MNPLGEIEARVRKLEDIEAIKKLKAKYWRCVDRKLWGEMTEVFTEEATADYGPDIKLRGRQANPFRTSLEDSCFVRRWR